MTIETFRYDSADYLDTEEEVAGFAEGFTEDEDPILLDQTVGVVIRALGLNALAAATGIARPALVNALSGEDPNRTDTFRTVLRAMASRRMPEAAE